MFIVVTINVIGFSDVNLVLLAADIMMILSVLPLEQRIHTLMKRRESKALLISESPITWLKIISRFSGFSFFLSLGYELSTRLNWVPDNPPINYSLLALGLFLFIFALIYVLRIAEFMIDPSSKINIFAGKMILKTLTFVGQVSIFAAPIMIKILDAFFLVLIYEIYQKGYTLSTFSIVYVILNIFSFIAIVPLEYQMLSKSSENTDKKIWIVLVVFFLPIVFLLSFLFGNYLIQKI